MLTVRIFYLHKILLDVIVVLCHWMERLNDVEWSSAPCITEWVSLPCVYVCVGSGAKHRQSLLVDGLGTEEQGCCHAESYHREGTGAFSCCSMAIMGVIEIWAYGCHLSRVRVSEDLWRVWDLHHRQLSEVTESCRRVYNNGKRKYDHQHVKG